MINCKYTGCNKPFEPKNFRHVFCSGKCQEDNAEEKYHRLQDTIKTCPICNKTFDRYKTKKSTFCSKECRDESVKRKRMLDIASRVRRKGFGRVQMAQQAERLERIAAFKAYHMSVIDTELDNSVDGWTEIMDRVNLVGI